MNECRKSIPTLKLMQESPITIILNLMELTADSFGGNFNQNKPNEFLQSLNYTLSTMRPIFHVPNVKKESLLCCPSLPWPNHSVIQNSLVTFTIALSAS